MACVEAIDVSKQEKKVYVDNEKKKKKLISLTWTISNDVLNFVTCFIAFLIDLVYPVVGRWKILNGFVVIIFVDFWKIRTNNHSMIV